VFVAHQMVLFLVAYGFVTLHQLCYGASSPRVGFHTDIRVFSLTAHVALAGVIHNMEAMFQYFSLAILKGQLVEHVAAILKLLCGLLGRLPSKHS
jgi:hypothetical protein